MGWKRYIESEQDKLDRMQRWNEAIAEIESYLQCFEDKGQQADVGCWVVRYQVRQKDKIDWYDKLQGDRKRFEQKKSESLSQYQYLGKAGTIPNVDAVMGVLRRTIVTELQSSLVSLKSCVIDIAYDEEHKSR